MTQETEKEYYDMVAKCPGYINKLNDFVNSPVQNTCETCVNTIKERFSDNQSHLKPCLGALNYFKKISVLKLMEDDTLYCACLNYWLNNELKKIPGNLYSAQYFYSTLENEDMDDSYNMNKCLGKIKKIDDAFITNMEKLYKIYDSFSKYKNNNSANDLSHCSYSEECVSSYKGLVTQCNSEHTNNFCNALKKFKDNYNNYVLSESYCKDEKEYLSHPETEREDAEFKRRGQTIFQQRLLSGNPEDRAMESDESDPTKFKIIIPVTTSVVLPIILFMLYKFTPFMSWFSSSMLNKSTHGHNLENGEIEELLNITYENDNVSCRSDQHFISYHSQNY
ncbi:PIR Superfamily Protein [Plasmodium ovale curtisi]|uniref:PIR Superfamily Protein n=1 Tax=Plasmodium ovale curtisi TaxID=864141 RepID=A0A1A8XAC8_PLAOA|nr:PIR Superfamily Protein [Plasmodium ovale curtisi]